MAIQLSTPIGFVCVSLLLGCSHAAPPPGVATGGQTKDGANATRSAATPGSATHSSSRSERDANRARWAKDKRADVLFVSRR